MLRLASFAVCLAAVATAASAHASTLTYSNVGTAATPVILTATATGSITGYFVSSNAGDTDTIALLDLTTGVESAFTFNNHSTSAGTSYNFGTVAVGDTLEFLLYNSTTKTTLSSYTNNSDGDAHAYITNYAGGTIGSVTYPAGVYVGFEDLLANSTQKSDLDYNDDTFIFTNVASTPSPVPEPGSLMLLGTGVLSAAGVLRRKLSRS